jgi:hypothetical protein
LYIENKFEKCIFGESHNEGAFIVLEFIFNGWGVAKIPVTSVGGVDENFYRYAHEHSF